MHFHMHSYKDRETLVNQRLVAVLFFMIIVPWEHYPEDQLLMTKEV